MTKIISVAIDGPGGAGKSTTAKALAKRYGFAYVDTGAMYRTVGLAVLRAGVSPQDQAGVTALLPGLALKLDYGPDGSQRMFLNGEDVTGLIRSPEISACASAVSALPAVRAFLLETQRSLAKARSVVMDGRDIGTVILPDATLKVFLTAAPEVRAQRRYEELRTKGTPQPYETVLREMNQRDRQDETRAAAPLKAAADAVLLDSSRMDAAQVLAALSELVEERLRA